MKNVLIHSSAAIVVAVFVSGCGFDDSSSNNNNPFPTPLPSGYNWSSQNSQSASKLHDVFFINSNQGWVVGDSLTLLATTNGGIIWPQVPSTGIVRNLRSAFFLDPHTGWMTGSSGTNPVEGQVLISKMGGAYPTEQEMVDRPLNTVFFLNKNTGWAGGDSSILLHTDNGGVNWARSAIGTKDNIFDLYFFNNEMGWAATDHGGIYRTKDGTTWNKEDLGITSEIHAIHFVDTLHGWACGSPNIVLRRELDSNNKVIWMKSSITSEPGSASWNDIFFINQQMGWVVGNNGTIYKTIDGGTTWMKESTAIQANLNAIYMVNGSTGWIVGDGGNILTYTP